MARRLWIWEGGRGGKGGEKRGGEGKEGKGGKGGHPPIFYCTPQFQFSRNMPELTTYEEFHNDAYQCTRPRRFCGFQA